MYAINLDTGIPGLKRKSRDSIPSEIASGSRDPGTPGLKTLILMNHLLSSKRTDENVIQLIVTLGSSFLLNKLLVPRDFSKPQLLEPIFQQFQLQSVDFSYCQFLDDSQVNLLVQCMTHHIQPLRKLVLRGTMFTHINTLNPLTRLECLDISELNYLQPIPECKSVQDYIQHFSKTFPHLTNLNIYSTNLSSQKECVPNPVSEQIVTPLSTNRRILI